MSSPSSIFNIFKRNVHKSECRSQPEMHTPNEPEDRRISMTSTNSLPVDMSSSKKKLCQRRSSIHTGQINGLSCCVEEENIEADMWGDSTAHSSGYASATTFRARSCTTFSAASTHQSPNFPNTASEPDFVGADWEDALHARG